MIKAIGTEQVNSPPETSGAALAASGEHVEPSGARQTAELPEGRAGQASQSATAEIPLLTLEEKRRILAQIARVNPMDCFGESGAFDIVRAKRILPPGSVRHISVHEITRLNAEGQPVTERRIDVRLVDPVSALRLDDLIERRREPTASRSSSTSSPNTKIFSRRDFNRLKEKTTALDDINQSIEQAKKALAEAADRELQLTNELAEIDRQLSQTLSLSNGSPKALSEVEGQTPSNAEGDGIQCEKGCQPVESKSPRQWETLSSSNVLSEAPSAVQGPAPTRVKGRTPAELADREARRRVHEREEANNSMGQIASANGLRKNKPEEWAKMQSEALSPKHQQTPASQPARPFARPPP